MQRLIAPLVLALVLQIACSGQQPAPAHHSADVECRQDDAFVAAYQPVKDKSDKEIAGTRSALQTSTSNEARAKLLQTLAGQLQEFTNELKGLPKAADSDQQVKALEQSLEGFRQQATALAADPTQDQSPFQQAARTMNDAEHDLDLQVVFMQGQCA